MNRFIFATTLGVFLSAFAGRIHSGGSINVTLPLYAWTAVLFGVAVHSGLSAPPGTLRPRLLATPARIYAIALIQFAILIYAPWKLVPSRAAFAHANAVLDQLAAVPGTLYVFDNAVDLEERGLSGSANSDAVFDVLRADQGPIGDALRADLANALRSREFSAIISDRPLTRDFPYPGAPADLLSGFDTDHPEAFPFATDTATVEPPHVAPLYLLPLR